MRGNIMISRIKSCSFTGHRPKTYSFGYDESSESFLALYDQIKNTIIQVCNAGCRTFYCGMAEGADLWCGEIVLNLKDSYDPPLKIIPVVPYLSQPVGMKPANQQRYRKIMEASEERFLVSRQFSKFCFLKRNHFLVDSADALIAVYSDKEIHSGTAQTIRYAQKKKKRIFMINV